MIEMLAAGGLAAMGPFPGKPTLYWRTRGLRCGTAADYRLEYVLGKNAEAEHTCRVGYWIEWAARADQMAQRVSDVVPDDDIRALANENDDDLMTVVLPATKKGCVMGRAVVRAPIQSSGGLDGPQGCVCPTCGVSA